MSEDDDDDQFSPPKNVLKHAITLVSHKDHLEYAKKNSDNKERVKGVLSESLRNASLTKQGNHRDKKSPKMRHPTTSKKKKATGPNRGSNTRQGTSSIRGMLFSGRAGY